MPPHNERLAKWSLPLLLFHMKHAAMFARFCLYCIASSARISADLSSMIFALRISTITVYASHGTRTVARDCIISEQSYYFLSLYFYLASTVKREEKRVRCGATSSSYLGRRSTLNTPKEEKILTLSALTTNIVAPLFFSLTIINHYYYVFYTNCNYLYVQYARAAYGLHCDGD